MSKIIVALAALLVLSAFHTFGQETIPSLRPELLATAPIGREPGSLGYMHLGAGAGSIEPGRVCAFHDKLYVPDPYNQRINVYDMRWQYVGMLRVSGAEVDEVNRSIGISFFDGGDLLSWTIAANILRVSLAGKKVFAIGSQGLNAGAFGSGEYWTWNDYVLYYDGGGKPAAIDKSGSLLHEKAIVVLLESMKQGSRLRASSERLRDAIDGFLDRSHLILAGDRLLTWDDRKMTEFFQTVHDVTQRQTDVAAIAGVRVSVHRGALYNQQLGLYHLYLGAADTKGYYAFITYDGTVTEKFYLDMQNKGAVTAEGAIADNGDVYGYELDLQSTPQQVRFYRLHRQGNSAPVGSVVVKLSAASMLAEPDDKNVYHPVKLFDGDPKTMWIENAKGPGIGESVTVGFDAPITTDEIQFMPGAFWKEYWKQNYRVKSLEVKLDDKVFTASFKDEMTVQSLKLSSPMTFKTAVFTIKAVYPTTKWEDTAISEITFYNQGAKIEVDYSKFKEFLKKAP